MTAPYPDYASFSTEFWRLCSRQISQHFLAMKTTSTRAWHPTFCKSRSRQYLRRHSQDVRKTYYWNVQREQIKYFKGSLTPKPGLNFSKNRFEEFFWANIKCSKMLLLVLSQWQKLLQWQLMADDPKMLWQKQALKGQGLSGPLAVSPVTSVPVILRNSPRTSYALNQTCLLLGFQLSSFAKESFGEVIQTIPSWFKKKSWRHYCVTLCTFSKLCKSMFIRK